MHWNKEMDYLLLFCRSIGMTYLDCSDMLEREFTVAKSRSACSGREQRLAANGVVYDPATMER